MSQNFESWGRFPKAEHLSNRSLHWKEDISPKKLKPSASSLVVGLGRSYGDVGLNAGGNLYTTTNLDRLLHFDPVTGIVKAESGLSLADLLEFAVPRGWFIPVSPGTKYVTLGGAVANDIHGKNHHTKGTFGRFVRSLGLLRSDAKSEQVLQDKDALFKATIAGMGLTGFITWIELQLIPIQSSFIEMEAIQFRNLEQFFEISNESKSFEYTVAWLDCVSGGNSFGRGIFMRGAHAQNAPKGKPVFQIHNHPKLSVPIDFPSFALSKWSIRIFNELWYRKQIWPKVKILQHYNPFFYPLDIVNSWNRIYGKRGFVQFQCVVKERKVIEQMLRMIVESGLASFLAVLKEFGSIKSPGIMSFPREGITLCLDFPMTNKTELLMRNLEDLVVQADGALYPAKDAFMSTAHFTQFYPNVEKFRKYLDPAFSSSFWRRVNI